MNLLLSTAALISSVFASPPELLICGSGASEGVPAMFCRCVHCEKARVLGGKNIRTRAGYLLGESIGIDWGPDMAHQIRRFGIRADRVRHLFYTHSHEDHLFPLELWARGVSVLPDGDILRIYANATVLAAIGKMIGGNWDGCNIRPVELSPGKQVVLSDCGITVTALAANHTRPEESLQFVFVSPGRQILLTGDTGMFPAQTFEALKAFRLNVVVIDATWGMERRTDGHLGIPNILDIRDRLQRQGSLAEHCRIVPTHFAHRNLPEHDALEAALAPDGITPAYDGMRIK